MVYTLMAIYKMIRIYKIGADSRIQARDLFREAETNGTLDEHLDAEFVKPEEKRTLYGEIKRQLTGGRK